MNIWLKIGLFLISRLSGPARDYMEKVFDRLEEKTLSTGTQIDDYLVKALRVILLGGNYISGGTGKGEELVSSIINKLSPAVRYELYQYLLYGYESAKNNDIEGDEIAVELLLNVLFPKGAPDKVDLTELEVSSVAPRFVGTRPA